MVTFFYREFLKITRQALHGVTGAPKLEREMVPKGGKGKTVGDSFPQWLLPQPGSQAWIFLSGILTWCY